MTSNVVPICFSANHPHLLQNRNKISGFGCYFRIHAATFRKLSCLSASLGQSPSHLENEKPLKSSDLGSNSGDERINSNQITRFHKDFSPLPKPLSSTHLVSANSDGSKIRVAYKGALGTYSEVAALKAYPDCETVPYEDFESVFKAVELWLVDKAILQIENSISGSVHRNYDLFLRHRLHIVREVQLVIEHRLLGLPGVQNEDLKYVLSHSKDDSDNITRFLILAREPIIPRTDKPHKTSIVFTLEEGPGVLFKALAVFALRDINLSKIESRPQRNQPLRIVDDSNKGSAKYFDYFFYIDFEASMAEPRAQYALGHLQEFSCFLRVLGCYPVDTNL